MGFFDVGTMKVRERSRTTIDRRNCLPSSLPFSPTLTLTISLPLLLRQRENFRGKRKQAPLLFLPGSEAREGEREIELSLLAKQNKTRLYLPRLSHSSLSPSFPHPATAERFSLSSLLVLSSFFLSLLPSQREAPASHSQRRRQKTEQTHERESRETEPSLRSPVKTLRNCRIPSVAEKNDVVRRPLDRALRRVRCRVLRQGDRSGEEARRAGRAGQRR